MIGTTVGSYRIKHELGRGGMAVVYQAEHILMGRKAAIKLLLEDVSNRESIVERFFFEARAISALRHNGIIKLYDFGYHEHRAYLVMELIEGETLSDLIKRERVISPAEAARLGTEIADALYVAHCADIVHRDLKPENVLLRGGTEVCLVDFGVAKLTGTDSWTSSQTASGVIIGTPRYMSPEQCRGSGAVDSRADLYSLGCLLYRMIAGRPPFLGSGGGEVIARHLFEPPLPLSMFAPGVPSGLESVIMRLLEKDPDARYQRACDVADALTHSATGVSVVPSSELPTFVEPMNTPTTTFGEASAEVRPRAVAAAPSRWKMIALGGAATFALAVVAIIATAATPEAEAPEPAVAAADTRAAPEPEPQPEPAQPEPEPAPASAPLTAPEQPDAEPRMIKIRLRSSPAGAEIVDDAGVVLGVTPLKLDFPARDEVRRLELRHRGYVTQAVELAGDANNVVAVDLKRSARSSHRSDPPRPAKPAEKPADPEQTVAKPEPPKPEPVQPKPAHKPAPKPASKPVAKPVKDGSLNPFNK